jgi:DNA-binding NarL/FixJ family response regulator
MKFSLVAQANMKRTIVVVDSHEIIRKSVAAFLSNQPDFEVVAESDNGHQAIDLVKRHEPDVAIVASNLPKLNGIETTRRISNMRLRTRVIILSNYAERVYVQGAIEAGAVGYIVKSGTVNDLLQAIRDASRSKIYLSPEVADLATTSVNGSDKNLPLNPALSPREREVLQLIAEGNSSKQIADVLGISETTVKSHRTNLMEKLGLHDTASLTRYAVRIKLVRY